MYLYCIPDAFCCSVKTRELKELQDQISMFQQTLSVKDEIIVSLTNENQDMITRHSSSSFSDNGGGQSPVVTTYGDISLLADERRELETLRVSLCEVAK